MHLTVDGTALKSLSGRFFPFSTVTPGSEAAKNDIWESPACRQRTPGVGLWACFWITHANGTLAHLGGKLIRPVHGFIFSLVGTSTKAGAYMDAPGLGTLNDADADFCPNATRNCNTGLLLFYN